MEEKRRKRVSLKKITVGVLLLVVVGLVIALLNIDTIARIGTNTALNHYLVAGGELEAVDVRLLEGRVTLSGLVIHPPPGFEPHPVLFLKRIEVDMAPWALLKGKVVIENLVVKGLSLNIIRDKKGQLSPLELMVARSPGPEPQPENQPIEEAPPWIPMVHAHAIQVEDVSFRLTDRMLEKDWSASLNAGLKIEGLQIEDVLNLDILVGRVNLKLNDILVDQPPGFSREPMLAVNKLAVASESINLKSPEISIHMVGLDRMAASLERNQEGDVNLFKLVDAWLPVSAEGDDQEANANTPATAADAPAIPFKLPTLVVDSIQLKSISAQLLDSMDGQPWRAGFDGLDLSVTAVAVGDLSEMAVSLASFDMDLRGINVDQPPGYSETPLLSMVSLKLASQGMDLAATEVTVSDVTLDTLNVSLERNADQEINLLKLAESWLPTSDEGNNDPSMPAPALPASPGPVVNIPAVVVDNIELKSISAQLQASIEDQPWRAGFDGLDVRVKGLYVRGPAQPAISLATIALDLKGIAVDQPPGFGNSRLVGLEQFTIISGKSERPGTERVIKQVLLQGLTSSVIMRADGVTNLQVLKEALFDKDEKTPPLGGDPIAEEEEPSPVTDLQPILFDEIVVDGGPITYRDEVFAEEPIEASLDAIHMEVKGLHLFTDRKDVEPAPASLTFELVQPGALPTAYFGALADVGPVGDGIPMVNSQAHLVGLKLDTLGTLVPKATRSALGATGLDAGLAMAMDADSINLNASVLTDRNIRYEGITVQGPLNKPVVKIGPVMAGVFGRVSDGMVNMGKSGLKSGVDITEGGLEAAKELGTGAAKVSANLGKSLFDTAAGVVTFDKEKFKEGAQGSTKGTIGLTKDSVKGTGQAAGSSLRSSSADLKGQDRVKAWEQDIPTRYEVYMQKAGTVLTEMPYPPVTE